MDFRKMKQSKLLNKIPVILDTDIGTDIDDVWALVMLLNSPELDIKLIIPANGNTTYRAKIVAKFLEAAGRNDIPIGIGLHTSDKIEAQGPWVNDYSLDNYPGIVYKDGIGAMIDQIMYLDEQTTLISIGPVMNILDKVIYSSFRATGHGRVI